MKSLIISIVPRRSRGGDSRGIGFPKPSPQDCPRAAGLFREFLQRSVQLLTGSDTVSNDGAIGHRTFTGGYSVNAVSLAEAPDGENYCATFSSAMAAPWICSPAFSSPLPPRRLCA